MATLTARHCPYPGCSRTDPHRHGRPDERESAARRGYDRHHQRWRQMVLARHPICCECLRQKVSPPERATVADHIVPLSQGGDWRLENGQGLCAKCHAKKTFSGS